MDRLARLLTMIGTSFGAICMPLHASDPKAAFSMTDDEFCRLSTADQRSRIASAFERRKQHAANIHYECLMLIDINEYHDGKLGQRLERLNGSHLRQWNIGRSFRRDTERGGADVSTPLRFISSGFDSTTGVARATSRSADTNRTYGRIDVVVDRINEWDRYRYWLDGDHTAAADFIFRYCLDKRDEWSIAAAESDDKILLSVPWYVGDNPDPLGTRDFVLDPDLGFMPVRGESHYHFSKDYWRRESFVVEDSELVGDVFMPTSIKEVIRASTLGDNKANVYTIKVSAVDAGKVVPSDLVVEFTPGMQVIDAINGQSYFVGPDGKPTRTEQIVGAPQQAATTPLSADSPSNAESTAPRWRSILVLSNVVIFVVALGYILWKRRAA